MACDNACTHDKEPRRHRRRVGSFSLDISRQGSDFFDSYPSPFHQRGMVAIVLASVPGRIICLAEEAPIEGGRPHDFALRHFVNRLHLTPPISERMASTVAGSGFITALARSPSEPMKKTTLLPAALSLSG